MISSSRLGNYGTQRSEYQAQTYQPSIFQNDEENSLHNMYGFKQNEVSIQEVFKFQPPQQQLNILENQIHMASMQNGKIWVLSRRNKNIGKLNLENREDRQVEVDDDILKRKNIKKIFVDSKGIHCFLLAEHEIFYNNWNSNKVFLVNTTPQGGKMDFQSSQSQPKSFKSIDLQYVSASDLNMFEILLGTEDGQIYHACLQYTPKMLEIIDPFVMVMDTQEYRPVYDIKMAKISSRQIILAITDTSLHQFVSENGIKKTFQEYQQNDNRLLKERTLRLDASSQSKTNVENEDGDDVQFNQLKLYTNQQKNQISGFGWMSEYCFSYASFNILQGEFIVKQKGLTMIKYIKKESDTPIENTLPNSFALTQFHIIFMYPKNITVLSKISNEIVYSRNFDQNDTILQGINVDMTFNRILLYGKTTPVYIAYLKGEDQDAWKYYLKRGLITEALLNCNTAKQKAYVSGIYADQLFQKQKYDRAAESYAQSEKTFEEVTLKFLRNNLYSALELYLQKIIDKIDRTREDLKPQRILLCTWIAELKLNEINNCQAQLEGKKTEKESYESAKTTLQLLKNDFHDFLMKNAQDIDHDTIFQLLQSHGRIDECIKFAEDVQSYETVIVHYINKQQYDLALQKVQNIADEKMKNNIMLRYASVFIKNLPLKAIEVLKTFKTIDIPKLIPAFMNISKGQPMDEALNYVIDYCIKRRKSREKTVHNLAFYFYAERERPEELLNFLRVEEMKKQEGHALFFETDYALNVCKQKEREFQERLDNQRKDRRLTEKEEESLRQMLKKMKKAQIILYAILGLHDKAVKLALDCEDINMAKDYANKPTDKKLKKKLWMKIAKKLFNYKSKKAQTGPLSTTDILMKNTKYQSRDLNQAQKDNQQVDVTQALHILKDSVLKIDDLLQLFPENAKVEDMKQHLCQCLDEYNTKIMDLKQQLEEHSKNAEILRKQKRKQRHKHITINPSQMCDICFTSIFKKEFYVFPCLHAFHRECVYKYIKNYDTKDPGMRAKIETIKGYFSQIETIKQKAVFIQNASGSGSMFGGNFGSGSNAGQNAAAMFGGPDDEMKKSLISDIRNYFTKSMRGGAGLIQGIGSMGIGGSGSNSLDTTKILQLKDQEDIRRIFNIIDDLLTRECFYCGSILIDMVDNDVVITNHQDYARDFEIANKDEIERLSRQGEEDWSII